MERRGSRLLVLLGRGSDTWKQMNYEAWKGALFAFLEGATGAHATGDQLPLNRSKFVKWTTLRKSSKVYDPPS